MWRKGEGEEGYNNQAVNDAAAAVAEHTMRGECDANELSLASDRA